MHILLPNPSNITAGDNASCNRWDRYVSSKKAAGAQRDPPEDSKDVSWAVPRASRGMRAPPDVLEEKSWDRECCARVSIRIPI